MPPKSYVKKYFESNLSVQAPQAQSTMTTKEMLKMFFPIVFISIILPLIDIVTDLRLIIQLYSSVVYKCIPRRDLGDLEKNNLPSQYWYYYYEDGKRNVSYSERNNCLDYDIVDLSNFCQQYPNSCIGEIHYKFATLLMGE